MKLDRYDWQKLQFPLLGLVAVLVFVSLLWWYTAQQQERALQAMQAQEVQLNQARQRYQASGTEKDTIVKYLPLYQQLIQRGFVGEERRIEWIDDLRAINQQYKLFGISYSIGAQENYKPPFNLNAGSFALHRSVMKIETALLHENDLLTIVNALSARTHAPFMLRDCVMSRFGPGAKNKFTPNLNATCEIDWLTIAEPQQAGGKP